MKPFKYVFLLIAFLSIAAACKKKDTTGTATDFREAYKGTYNYNKTLMHEQHPSGGVTTRTTTDSSGTLAISYNITDSLTNTTPNGKFTYPALKFSYSNGNTEMIGIQSNGTFVRFTTYYSQSGGFISADSFIHLATTGGVSFTDSISFAGKRIK